MSPIPFRPVLASRIAAYATNGDIAGVYDAIWLGCTEALIASWARLEY